jgi:hypothetical protein
MLRKSIQDKVFDFGVLLDSVGDELDTEQSQELG